MGFEVLINYSYFHAALTAVLLVHKSGVFVVMAFDGKENTAANGVAAATGAGGSASCGCCPSAIWSLISHHVTWKDNFNLFDHTGAHSTYTSDAPLSDGSHNFHDLSRLTTISPADLHQQSCAAVTPLSGASRAVASRSDSSSSDASISVSSSSVACSTAAHSSERTDSSSSAPFPAKCPAICPATMSKSLLRQSFSLPFSLSESSPAYIASFTSPASQDGNTGCAITAVIPGNSVTTTPASLSLSDHTAPAPLSSWVSGAAPGFMPATVQVTATAGQYGTQSNEMPGAMVKTEPPCRASLNRQDNSRCNSPSVVQAHSLTSTRGHDSRTFEVNAQDCAHKQHQTQISPPIKIQAMAHNNSHIQTDNIAGNCIADNCTAARRTALSRLMSEQSAYDNVQELAMNHAQAQPKQQPRPVNQDLSPVQAQLHLQSKSRSRSGRCECRHNRPGQVLRRSALALAAAAVLAAMPAAADGTAYSADSAYASYSADSVSQDMPLGFKHNPEALRGASTAHDQAGNAVQGGLTLPAEQHIEPLYPLITGNNHEQNSPFILQRYPDVQPLPYQGYDYSLKNAPAPLPGYKGNRLQPHALSAYAEAHKNNDADNRPANDAASADSGSSPAPSADVSQADGHKSDASDKSVQDRRSADRKADAARTQSKVTGSTTERKANGDSSKVIERSASASTDFETDFAVMPASGTDSTSDTVSGSGSGNMLSRYRHQNDEVCHPASGNDSDQVHAMGSSAFDPASISLSLENSRGWHHRVLPVFSDAPLVALAHYELPVAEIMLHSSEAAFMAVRRAAASSMGPVFHTVASSEGAYSYGYGSDNPAASHIENLKSMVGSDGMESISSSELSAVFDVTLPVLSAVYDKSAQVWSSYKQECIPARQTDGNDQQAAVNVQQAFTSPDSSTSAPVPQSAASNGLQGSAVPAVPAASNDSGNTLPAEVSYHASSVSDMVIPSDSFAQSASNLIDNNAMTPRYSSAYAEASSDPAAPSSPAALAPSQQVASAGNAWSLSNSITDAGQSATAATVAAVAAAPVVAMNGSASAVSTANVAAPAPAVQDATAAAAPAPDAAAAPPDAAPTHAQVADEGPLPCIELPAGSPLPEQIRPRQCFELQGGNFIAQDTVVQGRLFIKAGRKAQLTQGRSITARNGGLIELRGELDMEPGSALNIDHGSSFNCSGLLHMAQGSWLNTRGNTTFKNIGRIILEPKAQLTFSDETEMRNSGQLILHQASAQLRNKGKLENVGTIELNSGASLYIMDKSKVRNAGRLLLGQGAEMSIGGHSRFDNRRILTPEGLVTISRNAVFENRAAFRQKEKGELIISDNAQLLNNHTFEISGSALFTHSARVLNDGAFAVKKTGNVKTEQMAVMINTGTFRNEGGGFTIETQANFVNENIVSGRESRSQGKHRL